MLWTPTNQLVQLVDVRVFVVWPGLEAFVGQQLHHLAVVGQLFHRKLRHCVEEKGSVWIVGSDVQGHAGSFFLARSVVLKKGGEVGEHAWQPVLG